MVEPVEEAAHVRRVAQHGVVQGGAGQAQEGAAKEKQKDDLKNIEILTIKKMVSTIVHRKSADYS